MSKILVVQPYRILQHAIGLCLFPQHDTRITSSIPEAAEIEQVAAAVIDAAALRELNALSDAALRSLESWGIPIVWIDTVDAPPMPNNQRVIVIRTPINKENLERALAECLADSQKTQRRSGGEEPPCANTARSGKPDVIDLVEVVEVIEPAAVNPEDNSEPKQL